MSCITTLKRLALLLIIIIISVALNTTEVKGKTQESIKNTNTNIERTTGISKEHLDKITKQVKQEADKIQKQKEEKAKKEKEKQEYESHWESLGYCRCTEYCASCNSPSGHQSSSGTYLTDGCVACSWLSIGTKLRIDGYEYVVVDKCGTDAIDIFVDDGCGYCHCNMNTYKNVEIWQP